MGLLPKISGKYTYGFNVEKEYFDQQIEFLNENNTIYEEYLETFPDTEPLQIRKNLGSFMFIGDDVFKKINVLSGGEKVRLELCKIFKKNPNLLLLDEPTNHLDILGKETLEDLLLSYPGTIIFVSHDRYFINKIADSLLIFEKDKVILFNGTYSEYIKQKENNKKEVLPKEKKNNQKKIQVNNKKDNSLIKKLEKEIDIKEKKKKEIEQLMLDEKIYNDYKKMNELQDTLTKIEEEINKKIEEWEKLNS